MEFLPVPQKVTKTENGVFQLKWNTKLLLKGTEPSALLYAELLQSAVQQFAGLKLAILRGEPRQGDVVLTICGSLEPDHYTLSITEDKLIVAGGSDEALLHGIMTLRQYVQTHGALLPSIEIEDYPQLAQRGYYQDLARGRIPSLAQLKKTADILCRYKVNEWQLYIEHTYMFRDFSEAWRDDTPLTAEEIMELDKYCAARHIELVPSLSTFGHMYTILSTKSYCNLCEFPDSESVEYCLNNSMRRHTINVSSPKAMPTIKAMISEYMQLFTSKKFNICCDETWDLGRVRSKKLAEEKGGTHKLYINHVSELCSWLIDQGITPQFWGDILLHHPEDAAEIPEGTVCLNWDYNGNVPEDKIRIMAETGVKQYVCPGVHNWGTYIPRFRESFGNIQNMCRHGAKYGAVGLLNTDWGDFGAVCPPDLATPGIVYGAAFSWNDKPLDFDEVNRAVSFLVYGDKTGRIMEAMTALSGNDKVSWRTLCRVMDAKSNDALQEALKNVDAAAIPDANAAIDEGIRMLDEAAASVTAERDVIWQLQVCAEGVKLVNNFGLCIVEKTNGEEITVDAWKLAEEIENWLPAYSAQWRDCSKESMLRHVQDMFIAAANMLRGRKITLANDYFDQFD